MKILSLDVGTTQSGFCIVDSETYKPKYFGKIENSELIKIAKTFDYDVLVYEEFQSYGTQMGISTITSITWNGRFIQIAKDRQKEVIPIYRREVKMNLCNSVKANDSNVRYALISRFAKFDFKNGKGTKNEQDWFYGFKADSWSAYGIACTYLDKKNGRFR